VGFWPNYLGFYILEIGFGQFLVKKSGLLVKFKNKSGQKIFKKSVKNGLFWAKNGHF